MAALHLVGFIALVALWPAPSAAAEPPTCIAETAGTVACIGERLCLCRFERGGSMVERQPGHRWDCGPLRPACHRPAAGGSSAVRPFDELNLLLPLRDVPLRPPSLPVPPPG
jgi:hypothetical protein